ncbi:MAG: peptidylprolyl isomerase [Phycisphaerales bacterium]
MARRNDSRAGGRTSLRGIPSTGPKLEGLEARLLLAGDLPSITRIEADNRGLVLLRVNQELDPATVNGSAVRVFTAGNDRLLNTADDQAVSFGNVTYDSAARTIRFNAGVGANIRYKVEVNGDLITARRGVKLDAEFNGANVISGDGVAGGTMVFFTRSPATQVARVDTFAGIIDMDLLADRAPITVRNFLAYANAGDYDNSMFHRNAATNGVPFVVQGGGFRATTGFPSIPTRPQIQNEFGVSNTRGTVAMAKLGGNPNSATNQFFYNLGNNAANLDNQNGGFTVFARVRDAAGLAVMDDLSEFSNFNASSQNGAFDDLPVRNLTTVQTQGQARPEDVITINRISLLVDVAGTPGQQASFTNAVTVTGNAGQTVTFLDLTGNGFGVTDFATVRFGSGNTVSSITINKDFTGSAAIVVTGSSRVAVINDARRTTTGTIGYIALQDATLGALQTRGSIVGAAVGGFVVAPGFELPDDVDGDTATNDLTAVFAPGTGSTSSLVVDGSLTGGVRTGGSLLAVRIKGATTADFRTGGTASDLAAYTFAATDNTSIFTPNRISTLTATNWRVSDTVRKTIDAPTIRTLRITGTGDERGVFEAQLDLSGPAQGAPAEALTLGSATIKGGVFASQWDITGDMGPINLGPDADRWRLNVSGDTRSILIGRAVGSNITVTGNVPSFRASEWLTGIARAGTFGEFRVTQGGLGGGDGSFQGTLDTTDQNATTAIRSAVFTTIRNATVDARTVLASITANSITDSTVGGRTGFTNATLGDLVNTTIQAQNSSRRINIRSWDGGTLAGGTITNLNVTRDARFNAPNINAVLHMNIGGNLTTTLTTRGGFEWRVKGDILNSNINLNFQQTISSLLGLSVSGSMVNSNFRAVASVQRILVGRMDNSGIYVGAPSNQIGLPPNAANTSDAARIGTLRIFGRGSGPSMTNNSFIVTGRLGQAFVSRPDQDNGGAVHGIAANRITSLTLQVSGRPLTFNNPSTTVNTLGNFRVQLNAAPTT